MDYFISDLLNFYDQITPNNSKFIFLKHILHGGVAQLGNSKILMHEEIKAKSLGELVR